jgi:hypothetical protein
MFRPSAYLRFAFHAGCIQCGPLPVSGQLCIISFPCSQLIALAPIFQTAPLRHGVLLPDAAWGLHVCGESERVRAGNRSSYPDPKRWLTLRACQETTVTSWMRKPSRRPGAGTAGRHPRASRINALPTSSAVVFFLRPKKPNIYFTCLPEVTPRSVCPFD